MGKRVYRENPLKLAIRVVGAVIVLLWGSFLLFTFVFPSAPMPQFSDLMTSSAAHVYETGQIESFQKILTSIFEFCRITI